MAGDDGLQGDYGEYGGIGWPTWRRLLGWLGHLSVSGFPGFSLCRAAHLSLAVAPPASVLTTLRQRVAS